MSVKIEHFTFGAPRHLGNRHGADGRAAHDVNVAGGPDERPAISAIGAGRMYMPLEQEANDVLGGLDERPAILAVGAGRMDWPLEQEAYDVHVASTSGLDERPAILAIGEGRMDWPLKQEANDVQAALSGGTDERMAILAIGTGRIRGLQDRLADRGWRSASSNNQRVIR